MMMMMMRFRGSGCLDDRVWLCSSGMLSIETCSTIEYRKFSQPITYIHLITNTLGQLYVFHPRARPTYLRVESKHKQSG
jgi:hypothetical protein